jgi:hypothetical protein
LSAADTTQPAANLPATNLQILLAARPSGLPKPSDFEIVERPAPSPGDGEVLVQNLYLSLDPAMRGWMDDRPSYIPPVELGAVMRGLTVATVVESRAEGFAEGDLVSGALGWQQLAVAKPDELNRLPAGTPPTLALGPLGMTGLTAYFGLLDVGQPKEGDTVLVSAAAGAVGSVVAQIAKLKGCRVVGTAGGPDKCRWLTEELGLDAAIDYKAAEDLRKAVREHCPRGVDVYFDNVGGAMLEAALANLARGARVVICGAISVYNATEPAPGPANYLALLVQRARMEGFVIFDYRDRYPEALAELGGWVAAGKIRHREEIVDGLTNAPQAMLRLFSGDKQGKLMVKI